MSERTFAWRGPALAGRAVAVLGGLFAAAVASPAWAQIVGDTCSSPSATIPANVIPFDTATPSATAICSGGRWKLLPQLISNTTISCENATKGLLRYNGSNLQLCNEGAFGPEWTTVGGAGSTSFTNLYVSEKIGIGTETPGYPLQVSGSALVMAADSTVYTTSGSGIWPMGASTPVLVVKNNGPTDGAAAFLQLSAADAASRNDAAWIGAVSTPGTNYAPALVFGTRTTGTDHAERMRLDSSGRLGIGTSAPATQLSIHGTGSTGLQISMPGTTVANESAELMLATKSDGTNTLGSSSTAKGWLIYGRSDQYTTTSQRNDFGLAYWNGSVWSIPLRVDSITGNVGIGTTDPGAPLHVSMTDTTSRATIISLNASTGRPLRIQQPDSANIGSPFVFNTPNAYLFEVDDTPALLIDDEGTVAIGTSNTAAIPATAAFHVSGTTHISGSVGIGVTNSNHALHVAQSGGTSAARFGTAQSVAITNNWPSLSFNLYVDSGAWKYATSSEYGGIIQLHPTTGNMLFYTTPESGTADNTASGLLNALTITRDGRVGIGNGSPAGALSFGDSYSNAADCSDEPGGFRHSDGACRNDVLNIYQVGTSVFGLGVHGGTLEVYSPNDIQLGRRTSTGSFTTVVHVDADLARVGIGNEAPTYPLDVSGIINNDSHLRVGNNLYLGTQGTTNNSIVGSTSNTALVALLSGATASDGAFIQLFGTNSAGAPGQIRYYSRSDATDSATNTHIWYKRLVDTTAVAQMALRANGQLNVFGPSSCTIGSGSGATNCTSDARLKQDVTPYTGGLAVIENLKPVNFHWKKRDGKPHDPRARIGFLAQDVEPLVPQIVDTDEEGYKSLDYASIVVPLVAAVQELKAQNAALAAAVQELKAQNAPLEARLQKLEQRP